MALTHGFDLERPVCGYCGRPLQVGEHLLILQDDETGEMFDAHAECHEREMNTPNEDEPLSVH